MAIPKTLPAAKAPPRRPAPPPSTLPKSRAVTFGAAKSYGQKIGLYGPGGIGKTCLALMAPGPVAMYDYDESVGALLRVLPDGVDPQIVTGIIRYEDVRETLNGPGWDNVKTIIFDTVTRLEEMTMDYVIRTVPHEKGYRIKGIEDYGWGKGYTHIFEAFLLVLGDLDRHVHAGRNVILIAHDCTANVPNPQGDDWIRYEPRLQAPASGKASVRLRIREWLDHLLFIGYDVTVQGKKAQGFGSRTIYPNELPHCMAKSRTLSEEMEFLKNDTLLWKELFNVDA